MSARTCRSSSRIFPSKLTHAVPLALRGTLSSSSTLSGSSTGRKDSECGQIGVNRMAGTLGCTIDPPADTEYLLKTHTHTQESDGQLSVFFFFLCLTIFRSFGRFSRVLPGLLTSLIEKGREGEIWWRGLWKERREEGRMGVSEDGSE